MLETKPWRGSGARVTRAPASIARPWWPRHTPSSGTPASAAASITRREAPKSSSRSGVPGPGEITTWLNSPLRTRSGRPSASPAGTTRGSRPETCAMRWARLNVYES